MQQDTELFDGKAHCNALELGQALPYLTTTEEYYLGVEFGTVMAYVHKEGVYRGEVHRTNLDQIRLFASFMSATLHIGNSLSGNADYAYIIIEREELQLYD